MEIFFLESESSKDLVKQIGWNNCQRAAVTVLGIGKSTLCSLYEETNSLLGQGTFF